ncbi:MAG: conjugal transfer protein TrbF [Alphaproteobacteria bacterium]|nr:conjugal transfer protein TrbF [Alphaproteobacteria bacterium]
MMFKRTIQRYGQTPEPATPYQKAAQVWDERIGSARVQARNWRLMAFGALGLSVALAGGLLWQSVQSRVVPYVVEVDKLGGVRAVGPAIEAYNPNDAQIAYFLARFITDVRSLPSDPVIVRKDWLEAYAYTTDHAAAFLSNDAQRNDPFKAVGKRTVSVDVASVVRISKESFQVKWTEETYEQDALAKTDHWTAILSVVMRPPANADVLRKNPLGLYVNTIDWSRELSPGESD